MWPHCRRILSLPDSFKLLIALIFLLSSSAYADVCVWRDPDRTMSMVFPQARDYKTLDRKISKEKEANIERRLGKPLDPGERETWSHYEITGSNGTIGYVIADSEKGEYGAIEIVMGIMPDGKVKQVYIQRSRERDKEFKSKEFLDQFVGKTKVNPITIGKDIKAGNSTTSQKVAFAVRKMLAMFDNLH
ncbi:MAG: hypothetical protein KGJ11_00415 [Candidatus Omnitrophica bacterium]|nr:hypothetical protein [Candidatus Omnitrophota bacterium]